MRIGEVDTYIRKEIQKCKDSGKRQVAPIYITSKPGLGKSQLIDQISKHYKVNLYDCRLAQFAPEDLRGVPYPNAKSKTTEWFTPSFFPREDTLAIMFIDELDKAKPAVQNAALQLFLDRRLGEYRLPDKVFLIAAGNTLEDNSFSIPLSSALNNRMLHIDMESNVNDWIKWAKYNINENAKSKTDKFISRIQEDIIGFIQFKPQILHSFNDKERAWPSPRTWEFLSQLMQDNKPKDVDILNYSTMAVGQSTAREFHAYRKIYKSINPKGILQGEFPTLENTDVSFKYAISTCIGFHVRNNGFKSKDECKNCLEFLVKLSDEFKVISLKLMMERNQLNNKMNEWCPEETENVMKNIFEKIFDV